MNSRIEGKLIQYKWIDEEFDDVYALLDFTYGQQLNNLNLDSFGIVLTDYFENVEDLFLYGITGKRRIILSYICTLINNSIIYNF
jgi:hypothetical protein